MLTNGELEKYNRQIIIRGFDKIGQEKLKNAKVFIAGAGGLGSSIALYLTAAGIGTIRIIDHDSVEPSNLNRQILHWESDLNRKKAESAYNKLTQLNPSVKINPLIDSLSEENASQLIGNSDLIVDAMDNLQARYLLNKISLHNNIPLFHGAIYGFEGRATTIIPHKTACLRCTYRGVVPGDKFPVIGVTPGIIGCIQATEVIKYIVGLGQLLLNRLLIFDGLNMKFTEFMIKKDPHCSHCSQLTKEQK